MKKADLEGLTVLASRRLSQSELPALSDLFDEMVEAEFERFPGMANCQARRALDDDLSRTSGMPHLGTLRVPLASKQ